MLGLYGSASMMLLTCITCVCLISQCRSPKEISCLIFQYIMWLPRLNVSKFQLWVMYSVQLPCTVDTSGYTTLKTPAYLLYVVCSVQSLRTVSMINITTRRMSLTRCFNPHPERCMFGYIS